MSSRSLPWNLTLCLLHHHDHVAHFFLNFTKLVSVYEPLFFKLNTLKNLIWWLFQKTIMLIVYHSNLHLKHQCYFVNLIFVIERCLFILYGQEKTAQDCCSEKQLSWLKKWQTTFYQLNLVSIHPKRLAP